MEEGEASCQGVRVSVEGEVVLFIVHSRAWVGVSHLVFHHGNGSVHSQEEDEARQSLCGSPLSSLHVSSCSALKRTAHHFHILLSRASISFWVAPHSTTPWAFFTYGGVSVDGDVGRDDFVQLLWALFHPHSKLVGARHAAHLLGEKLGGGLAYETPDDLSDGEGADSAIGFGGGDDSRREVVLCGESPKGFPHASTRVSVKFRHPRPIFIPSTTMSRGSVGGGKT